MAIKKVITVSADTKEAQKEFDLLEKNIQEADDQVVKLERHLLELQKAQSKQGSGSVEYKRLGKEIKKVSLRLKEEKMDLKELKKEKSKNLKITKDQTKATKSQGDSMGLLNKLTGGLAGKMKNAYTSVLTMVKGMNLLRIAVIATGVGALVIAVISLMQAFTRSEKGQDMFAKGMAMIGAVVNQIMDLFADFGEVLIDAFKNPKEAWESFKKSLETGWDFIKAQIVDRFQGSWAVLTGNIEAGILKMRIAWNEWTGDAEEAQQLTEELEKVQQKVEEGEEAIKRANQAVADGYKKAVDKVKEFVAETEKEIEIAASIADKRAKAHKMERQLLIDTATDRRKINELRLKAEDREKFSATERIEMLREAQALEDKLAADKIKAKQLVIDALKMEHAMGKTSKQSKDELAQLEAELIDLDTKKLRGKRLLQTQITTALNQEKAAKEEEIANEEAVIEKKKELLQGFEDFKKSLREAEVNTQAEEFAMELENIDEKFLILQEKALEQREAGLLTDEEWFQYVSQIDQAHTDALEDADRKHKKILFDQGVKADKDALDEKIKIMQEEENLRQKKMRGALNFFQGMQAISELAGKKGRAFAIAAIITEQAMSISKIISNLGQANLAAVASVPPYQMGQPMVALNTIMAVANIAKGLSQAKKSISNIRSKKKTPAGPPPITQMRASVPSAVTAPTNNALVEQPSFSTVGQSGTNQIAEALGQEQPPVQAYVVAQDVTTAQSLEHNIISSASIG